MSKIFSKISLNVINVSWKKTCEIFLIFLEKWAWQIWNNFYVFTWMKLCWKFHLKVFIILSTTTIIHSNHSIMSDFRLKCNTFQQNLWTVKKHVSEVQNIFCMKSWIEGHRIGRTADSVWIGLNQPSWLFSWKVIQCYLRLFHHTVQFLVPTLMLKIIGVLNIA